MNISPISTINFELQSNNKTENITAKAKNFTINQNAPTDIVSFSGISVIIKPTILDKKHILEEQKAIVKELCAELSDETGDTKAHNLAQNNPKELSSRLNELEDNSITFILSIPNKANITPANILAKQHPEIYYDITKGFLDLRRYNMLKIGYKSGNSVAHDLAYSSPKTLKKIISRLRFPLTWRKEILDSKNESGETVREILLRSKNRQL